MLLFWFVMFSFIPVSMSELNERNWIWNSSTETWLDFHVKYCGRFCTGNMLNGHNICYNPPCLPCDCDSNCFIYDTCCPLFVNNSYIEPPLYEIEHLPDSDIFQCQTLPYKQNEDKYYIVSSCDPKFSLQNKKVLDQFSRNIVDLCRNPNTRTLDDITPYSDIYYGIIFANKFCAMCNGYEIDDTRTNNKNIKSSVKIASAWYLEVSCEHYQELYHFTSEYEFLLAATNYKCTINITAPLTKFKPKSCASRVDNYSADNCGDFYPSATHLCNNLNRRYLQVGSKANIFCYLCDNGLIAKRFCQIDKNRAIGIPLSALNIPISQVHEPPYIMLLRFTIRPTLSSTDDTTCISPAEWQDLKVIFVVLVIIKS
ncbi:hypothetical protein BgiMline_003582 [Biomphalaria glabrata]|nr:hypothetical protein BgiMline_012119 [Biomphalaria glabrata]